ncbi:Wzz/FepE/Etk N-terminal domain-containing protein [Vibrio astriarenae]
MSNKDNVVKAERISLPNDYLTQNDSSEVDLLAIMKAVWKGKWLIVVVTAIFSIAGVLYALSQPNVYKAQVLLSPTQGASSGGGVSGSLSNLAAFAGVSIGGGAQSDPKVEALAILQSRQFIDAFIQGHNLKPSLMALSKWDSQQNVLEYDEDLFDSKLEQWRVVDGKTVEPTLWETNKEFINNYTVSENKENGMVIISIQHQSPFLAKEWIDWIVKDINSWMKNKALSESTRKIQYLEGQIKQTQVTELQNMFYSLIEEQYKTLMLAEVDDEFVFKTIDPAVYPEDKSGPKRALICILSLMLGLIVGVLIVLANTVCRKDS